MESRADRIRLPGLVRGNEHNTIIRAIAVPWVI